MLLLTNHGERPIHYDFGANLRGIVFDQAPDASQRVVDSVSVAMEKWMPFVKIDSIIVEDYNSNKGLNANEINVKLKFSIGQLEGSLEQRIR
jgi:phage baseplate assembly protein W